MRRPIITCLILGVLFTITFVHSVPPNTTISPFTYTLYYDGTQWQANNGITAVNDYSNADAGVLLNTVISHISYYSSIAFQGSPTLSANVTINKPITLKVIGKVSFKSGTPVTTPAFIVNTNDADIWVQLIDGTGCRNTGGLGCIAFQFKAGQNNHIHVGTITAIDIAFDLRQVTTTCFFNNVIDFNDIIASNWGINGNGMVASACAQDNIWRWSTIVSYDFTALSLWDNAEGKFHGNVWFGSHFYGGIDPATSPRTALDVQHPVNKDNSAFNLFINQLSTAGKSFFGAGDAGLIQYADRAVFLNSIQSGIGTGLGVPGIVSVQHGEQRKQGVGGIVIYQVGNPAISLTFRTTCNLNVLAWSSGTINCQVTYTDPEGTLRIVTVTSASQYATSGVVAFTVQIGSTITIKTNGTFSATYDYLVTLEALG